MHEKLQRANSSLQRATVEAGAGGFPWRLVWWMPWGHVYEDRALEIIKIPLGYEGGHDILQIDGYPCPNLYI